MLALILSILQRLASSLEELNKEDPLVLLWGNNDVTDLYVGPNQTVRLTAPGPGQPQKTFQYRTVTVEEGGQLYAEYNPFVIQAREYMHIKGALHMDGRGGAPTTSGSHSSWSRADHPSGATSSKFFGVTLPTMSDYGYGYSATLALWKRVFDYMKTNRRFDLSFNLTGGGGSNRYSWKRWGKNRSRHHPVSGISFSPVPNSDRRQGGAGGGVCVVVYGELINEGPVYEGSPVNIHANGAASGPAGRSDTNAANRGGGQIFVATPSLRLGPKGRISSNAAYNGNGPCAIMNIPNDDAKMGSNRLKFNNGNPTHMSESQEAGGAGICIGIDVNE